MKGVVDSGFDCSGAVSYALRGAAPAPAAAVRRADELGSGRGTWITVYAHGGHAYAVIAGFRFDTSMHDSDARVPQRPALESDPAGVVGVRRPPPAQQLIPRSRRASARHAPCVLAMLALKPPR